MMTLDEHISIPGAWRTAKHRWGANAMFLASFLLVAFLLQEIFWFDFIGTVSIFFAPLIEWPLKASLLAVLSLLLLRSIRPTPSAPLVFIVLLASVLAVVFSLHGYHWGARLRLLLHEQEYQSVVTQVRSTQPTTDAEFSYKDGLAYIVDKGPPLRVAFPWPGGILDNWCGAVYDPSGYVLNSDLRDVRGLFGGDIVHCSALGGAWSLCCFT